MSIIKRTKKLLYIADVRMPTEKGHGAQIVKMCEAFALRGFDVELVVPRRFNAIKEPAYSYYGVQDNFTIKYLPTIDLMSIGRLGFFIEAFTFSLCAAVYAWGKRHKHMIYSRTDITMYLFSLLRVTYTLEVHTKKRTSITRRVITRARSLVVISEGLREYYSETYGAGEKIIVAHDGVDLSEYESLKGRDSCQKALGFTFDTKVKLIGYIGKMSAQGTSKGVEGIIEAFALTEKKNPKVKLLLVGVLPEEMDYLKNLLNKLQVPMSSVLLVGHVKREKVPLYMKSCDVLVLNYSSDDNFYSPLKLFEYMASGVTIVSSDAVSVMEVLDESVAWIAPQGDSAGLAVQMTNALHSQESSGKATKALTRVKEYSWEQRVDTIVEGAEDE